MRLFAAMMILVGIAVGFASRTRPAAPTPVAQTAAASTPASERRAALPASPGSVDIPRAANGHFTVDASVDGATLPFIVDTGASEVALGREDARRLGLWVGDGDFDGTARTASGTVRIAHRTLPRLRVGAIELADVATIVLDVAQAPPLLGQSFLGRIDHVAITGDRMTLTQN